MSHYDRIPPPASNVSSTASRADGGVSRARSAARASRRAARIPITSGHAPPRTRLAVRSVSSSVVTASCLAEQAKILYARIFFSAACETRERHSPPA